MDVPDFDDGTASLEAAYAVAGEFGLNLKKAAIIAREVAESTRNWEWEASRFGAEKEEIESMRSAFEHKDLRDGLR
jgi:serine/threonine-protein kinase HipA